MKKKNVRLFELLVVGGGLWVASGCGDEVSQPQQRTTVRHITTILPDGGEADGGDVIERTGGGGSGFW